MKILLITSMVPQREGAGAIPELLHAQLQGLLERHDVTVITTFGDLQGQAEAAADLRRSGIDIRAVDRRRSRSPARRWQVRMELAANWLGSRRPWRVVSSSAGMQPLIDEAGDSFDVVAVEENPVSMLRLPAHLPRVLTEHEASQAPAEDWRNLPPTSIPRAILGAVERRRWRRFQPPAWRRFDLLQTFCKSDAASIASRAPDLESRVRINPFGLVLPEPVDPTGEAPGTMLFAGAFSHAPNRDAATWLAREVMPRISKRRPGARLRIVGSSPPREIRELACADIDVVADVPSMRPEIEAASVILAPVRTGGGMRMKVLQGLAAGKAVVTTSRGAEGFDVFETAPPMLIADSAEDIAAAATELLADDVRRRDLARRARVFAERHHSPAAWAKRLEAVYEEAIDIHRSRHVGARPSGSSYHPSHMA